MPPETDAAIRDLLNQLANDPHILETSPPTLFHPDLHKRNIRFPRRPHYRGRNHQLSRHQHRAAFYYADESPDFASPVGDDNMAISVQAFDACMKGLVLN
ncbi:uncharacterized protein ATNIH1004_000613 [Aspergillus tanneri]|uniref:Uncharacterized protein n=1 Tax=Aspergillus tanneri TaxID=1220188 RepID=A0A5M9NB28_9EURO|nr:uncharacterized protein ATNIH1004_000613 [Aspergillus tanneri]KAA8651717.1 hypothetical protein ATNIH1004_000613 [Aspergillus tanneri]